MPDPDEEKNLLSKTWRENLNDVIGARRAAVAIGLVGLIAFGLAVYKYADVVLAWFGWMTHAAGR